MEWFDSLIQQSGLFSPPAIGGVASVAKGAIKAAYFAGVRDGLAVSAVAFAVLLFVLTRRK